MSADADAGKKERSSLTLPVAQEPSRFRLLSRICAVFVAGIGLVALLGWALGLPFLTSLGSGKIPVAPITAVLLVLYAVAVFLRAWLPSRRGTYWAGLSINSAGALVALLLFVLSSQGVRLEGEHLGFTIVNTAGEPPKGHISPVTAVCFLLAALSFLASLSPSARPRWATMAWWLAFLLITISVVLVLAYLYGVPLLYGSSFIPPAALTSVAFMALGIALLGLAGPYARLVLRQAESTTRASYAFILIFVILAAGIITAGYLSHKHYEKRHRTEVEQQLLAIADLKVNEIVQWRKERLEDGAVFYKNFSFSGLVQRFFEAPADADAQGRLRTWLLQLREGYQYDRVFLLDTRGNVQMSAPETQRPISRHASLRAAEVLRTKQMAFEDFHRNEHDGRIYLAVLVPILDGDHGSRVIGVLALRIDPTTSLYPFIQRWPTPSQTAETLLVRREGNEALFLSELRFQKNTALNLRISLDHKDMPAVQAALGNKGIMEGRDYRGVPVIADVRPVPDSPWFLVSRMDAAEVSAPLKERLWMMVGFVVVLLFGAGAGVGLVWRQQSLGFYREQCKAADALRESEERYRSLFVNMLEGFAYCKMLFVDNRPQDFVYLEVNSAFEVLTGLKNVAGRRVSDVIPGIRESDPGLFEIYGRVALTGKPERFEIYVEALTTWFNISVYSPKKEYFVAVFDVITERKRAEEELRKHRDHLDELVKERTAELQREVDERKRAEEKLHEASLYTRSLIEISLDPLVTISKDGKITDVNKGTELVTGISREQLIGSDFSDYFTEPEKAREGYQQVFEKGFVKDYPLAIRHVSGSITDVLYNASVYRDAFGNVAGVFAAARDITERKLAEEEVKKLNEDLKRHVILLEAANKELEAFSYSVSHDLRAPLRHLTGFVELLNNRAPKSLDEKSKHYLTVISDSAQQMGRLVDDLLSFSRMGRTEMTEKQVNLEHLVKEILKELQTDMEGRNILWKIDPLPEAYGDASMLRLVFVNLVSNAIKFTRKQPQARVEIGCVSGNQEEQVFFVRDNGVGFDMRYVDKLFGLFQRLHRPEDFEGTGVGLANVQRIIHRHGGKAWAEGSLEGGATFYFSLPRK